MDTTELLKQVHSMIITYRAEKGFGNNEFARISDLEKTALVAIEDVKLTDKGKIRTIDLLTLLKIFNAHPALKERILNYLRGNTDKKLTDDGTSGNNEELTELEELVDKQMLYIEQLHGELRRLRKRIKGDKEGGEIAGVSDN